MQYRGDMKLRHIFLSIFLFFGGYAEATEYLGQVVFYSYIENPANKQDGQEQTEIESDLSYQVGNLLEILENKKIKNQIVNSSNFIVLTINGKKLQFSKIQLPVSTGYIMIRKNGEYLVRNGMGSDVDMMLDIYEYFGIKP